MTREQIGLWTRGRYGDRVPFLLSPMLENLDTPRPRARSRTVGMPSSACSACAWTTSAYPFGSFTPTVIDEVKRCGYASAVTTEPRIAGLATTLYRLPRMIVDGRRGLLRFPAATGEAPRRTSSRGRPVPQISSPRAARTPTTTTLGRATSRRRCPRRHAMPRGAQPRTACSATSLAPLRRPLPPEQGAPSRSTAAWSLASEIDRGPSNAIRPVGAVVSIVAAHVEPAVRR
jgi:hypothetical protein